MLVRHADRGPRLVAVGGVDEHPHDGVGVGLGVEDAHPVVGEVDVARAAGRRRRAARRRAWSRALTGPLPSPTAMQPLVAHPDLHGGLGVDGRRGAVGDRGPVVRGDAVALDA